MASTLSRTGRRRAWVPRHLWHYLPRVGRSDVDDDRFRGADLAPLPERDLNAELVFCDTARAQARTARRHSRGGRSWADGCLACDAAGPVTVLEWLERRFDLLLAEEQRRRSAQR